MPIVLLPPLITAIIILIMKRRDKAKAGENYYYGKEHDDYEEGQTRVEDLNDYYEYWLMFWEEKYSCLSK